MLKGAISSYTVCRISPQEVSPPCRKRRRGSLWLLVRAWTQKVRGPARIFQALVVLFISIIFGKSAQRGGYLIEHFFLVFTHFHSANLVYFFFYLLYVSYR